MIIQWKDKILKNSGNAIQKWPALKPVIMLYLIPVLALLHILDAAGSNCKRIAGIAVLLIFFTISCSFSAPVFIMQSEPQMMEDPEEPEHDISLAEVTSEEDVVLMEETESVSYQNPEVINDDTIDNYSIDEILENNIDYTAESAADESTEDDWKVLLINKQHPIPDEYQFTLGTITGNLQCDERIIPELLEMLQAAKRDGVSLLICSPYRDMSRQEMLFNRKITNYMKKGLSYLEAYKLASQAVTIPGSSEHQVGLALDIYTDSYKALNEGFGETPAGIWLANHCTEYGFILRYPKDKEYITGIEYEPWHFRYVGKNAAAIIKEQGLTLEEYDERSTDTKIASQ